MPEHIGLQVNLRAASTCPCCHATFRTSGCVRGFPCSCSWGFCRVCQKCTQHCACAWRVEVLFDSHAQVQQDYEGKDFEEVEKRVGHLVMIRVTERIIVYKNGEEYRRIDAR